MGEPSTKTVTFPLTDVEGSTALPAEFPPLRSLEAHPNTLPRELTSFVGREREVAEVKRLLGTTRLLTLTGSGGVGKTRLAERVAGDLPQEPALSLSKGPAYPDGVWVVELAALGDPALVPQAVASALGIREQPGRALPDTLIDVLRPQACLLLLDNCEHLVEACAALAVGLLRACPGLSLLATSREPLGVPGETVWRVPPLTLPDALHGELPTGDASAIGRSEAVCLFDERARAALPTFTLTNQNAPAVAQICRRLDGIPLAIELAAARVRGLVPGQIAARLDDHLRLLTGGSRTALPRHQTLRALVDWSHALLSEPEQVLFRRLSVFAGGWALEAAERVCADEEIEAEDVLGLLLQLVDRSLVLAEEQPQRLGGAPTTRYRLLETLRQYGAEKLRAAGEEVAVREHHLEWCLGFAEEAGASFWGPGGSESARRLELEHDNLRAALRWSLMDGAEAAGLGGQRLAGALWDFWWRRGHLTEGSRWLVAALSIAEPVEGSGRHARARALFGAGLLTGTLVDYDGAVAFLEESLALFRPAEDPLLASLALSVLGNMTGGRGDYEGATTLLEESLVLAREADIGWLAGWQLGHLGRLAGARGDDERATTLLEESLSVLEKVEDRHGASWTLQYLGRVMQRRGDHERASLLFEEGLAAARDVGDRQGIAWSLGNLGRVARMRGDYARATELLEESLGVCRDIGDRWGAALALGNLGRVALARNDHQRAAALFEESLVLCRDLSGRRGRVAYALHYLGVVASALGQPERAARLQAAAEVLRKASGRTVSPLDLADHDRQLAAVRRALGEERFAAAWAAGQSMSLDQAIDYALTSPSSGGTPSATPDPSTTEPQTSPLSAREQEVAALLARGLSNRQIAEELVISSRTASTHVTHILNKLGFANRSQIAAWAVEHDLVAR